MSEELRELVLAGASATEIKRTAIALGHDDAAAERHHQARRGVTTVEEVAAHHDAGLTQAG